MKNSVNITLVVAEDYKWRVEMIYRYLLAQDLVGRLEIIKKEKFLSALLKLIPVLVMWLTGWLLSAFGNQFCLHLLLKLAWCSLGL